MAPPLCFLAMLPVTPDLSPGSTLPIVATGPQEDCGCQSQVPSSYGRSLTRWWPWPRKGYYQSAEGLDTTVTQCAQLGLRDPFWQDRISTQSSQKSGPEPQPLLDSQRVCFTNEGAPKGHGLGGESPCRALPCMGVALYSGHRKPCLPRGHKRRWPGSGTWTCQRTEETRRLVPYETGSGASHDRPVLVLWEGGADTEPLRGLRWDPASYPVHTQSPDPRAVPTTGPGASLGRGEANFPQACLPRAPKPNSEQQGDWRGRCRPHSRLLRAQGRRTHLDRRFPDQSLPPLHVETPTESTACTAIMASLHAEEEPEARQGPPR